MNRTNEPWFRVIVTIFFLFGCASAQEGRGDAGSSSSEVAIAATSDPPRSPSTPRPRSRPPWERPRPAAPVEVVEARLRDGKSSTPRRETPAPAARGQRRGPEADPWALPLPMVRRDHPAFSFTDPGSISVGTVVAGSLVRGRELPLRGPHHAVLFEHSARATRWGTDELVDAVLAAADHVAASRPGAVLGAANMARRGGGRLPWSISHKAGRDVDIGFYYVDGTGLDVLPDTLLQVAPPDGTVIWEGRELRFDVSRNYLLLESLLTSDRVAVQYVFCADFLVKKLRAEARRRGAPRGLRKTLETIVRQPRGTLPHDDHFHVRILCSPEDRLEGCRDIVGGREVIPDNRAWQDRVAKVAALLDAPAAETRSAAARALGLLRARSAQAALEVRFDDPDGQVRRAALEALAVLWKRPPSDKLAAWIRTSDDPAIVEAGLRLLRSGGRRSRCLVRDLLADPRVIPDTRLFPDGELVVRLEAAVLAGWLADERLFRPLVECAADPDPRVRRAVDRALRFTTNHAVLADDGARIEDAAALVSAWEGWARRAGGKRSRWLREGFDAAGVDVSRKSRRAARALLALIVSDQSHLAFNAQRILADWCPGRGPGVGLQNRWWIRRKWKRGIERCFR